MPNLAISEYPQASPLELSDQLLVERGGSQNFRASISQIIDAHGIVDHPDTDATGAELNTLTDGSNADALHGHAPAAHTIASHSDTSGTGPQLDTLTNNSMADTLHRHSELSASDGTPDAVVTVDAVGSILLDAASGQTVALAVNATEELQVSGTAVTIPTNNLIIAAGNLDIINATVAFHFLGTGTGRRLYLLRGDPTNDPGGVLTTKNTAFQIYGKDGDVDELPSIGLFGFDVSSGANTPTMEMAVTRATRTQHAGATRVAVSDGDILGVINWLGDDGTDLRTLGASIKVQVNETAEAVGVNRVPTEILIITADVAPISLLTNNLSRLVVEGNGDVRVVSGNLGIGVTPTLPFDVHAKAGFTSIGGYAIKLTNKTGSNTVLGQLVIASTSGPNAFETAGASDDRVIGIVLDAGVADGSEAWMVVAGFAQVLIDAGGASFGNRIISSTTAGSGLVDNGPATPQHFQEIGHSMGTTAGGGLVKCSIHLN